MEASPKMKHSQSSTSDLFASFIEDFSFNVAISDAEKNRIYKLRHEVYCQEIGYHPPGTAPKNIEIDAHDSHSIHCLVEHRRSGLAAGCLRLVLPASMSAGKNHRLPLQEYGEQSLSHGTLHPAKLPYDSICEISRFAIARAFRHKPIKHETLDVDATIHEFTPEEKKTFSLIIIALFLATYALVGLMDKRHVFAMMEPRLPRLLSMSGFHFTKVGESIEMHGTRNAFYIDHRKAEQEMHEDLMPLYQHIRKELSSQLEELPISETWASYS
ncbi:PEP-CTERM/exosortase system-associated acyltransferase [Halomonas daqiaonensis]|uniref:N-acyl amino acid synthase, PEP-CTERM/exosortase system-associated n=1 Tax=Halomonas daqiaonensis TaxID=650850 RepID=A0A1H7QUM8_9GAMM|nr:PEP-CTERM/exosortase system-associated acyltransferase [Halomonas daqiaonensis]SEL51007.1 N-acyl amino acid synthase, PEP-CTERM/exosortase system-associated [Halomonas daqiaonensis]